jgi:SAM-dependent methyltransferase
MWVRRRTSSERGIGPFPLRKEAHFATNGNRSRLEAPSALLDRLAAVDAGGDDRRALVAAIVRMSEAYTVDRASLAEVGRSPDGHRARLRFFLPRDLPKAARPMLELAARGLIPRRDTLRLLDLGCGLGTTTLSVARGLALAGDARSLDVVAVDDDPRALETFERIVTRPIEGLEAHAARLPEALDDLRGPFDLVTIGLALNEIIDPAALVERASAFLAPDGVLLIVEPALRETTRALMRLRDQIAHDGRLAILGPCPHQRPCPMLGRERDWCHDAVDAPLPAPLDAWARDAGLRDERATFAWLALGRTPPHDPLHRVVSHRLPSKGKLELILCTPEGELARARRLDRHRSDANEALESAARGDRLSIEGETRGNALVIGRGDLVATHDAASHAQAEAWAERRRCTKHRAG